MSVFCSDISDQRWKRWFFKQIERALICSSSTNLVSLAFDGLYDRLIACLLDESNELLMSRLRWFWWYNAFDTNRSTKLSSKPSNKRSSSWTNSKTIQTHLSATLCSFSRNEKTSLVVSWLWINVDAVDTWSDSIKNPWVSSSFHLFTAFSKKYQNLNFKLQFLIRNKLCLWQTTSPM